MDIDLKSIIGRNHKQTLEHIVRLIDSRLTGEVGDDKVAFRQDSEFSSTVGICCGMLKLSKMVYVFETYKDENGDGNKRMYAPLHSGCVAEMRQLGIKIFYKNYEFIRRELGMPKGYVDEAAVRRELKNPGIHFREQTQEE